ncbi:claudin-11 isoform X2 [Dendrobates tinctorius]|uniref:claudin-11 isoform X2 n=1 Tax=Dendrobates tinctorius TaxID=92724 RepID=UPI003CC9397A
MAGTCLQFFGFVSSFVGWIGVVVATTTNDWVLTCDYSINTCRKLDELGSRGLWADCVISIGLYHCKPLADILTLPAHIQAARALMITGSFLGLPAVFLLLSAMPCIRMGHDPGTEKYKRFTLGGVLIVILVTNSISSAQEIPLMFPQYDHVQFHLVYFHQDLWTGRQDLLIGKCSYPNYNCTMK